MLKTKSCVALSGIVFLFAGYFVIVTGLASCKNYHRNQSYAHIPTAHIEKGEVLAAQYCQSCHMLPDPAMVDAKTWEKGVLPEMGPRLGVFSFGFQRYPSRRHDSNLPPDFYPSKPVVTPEQWQYILEYYAATAPDSLSSTPAHQQPIAMGLPLFSVEMPAYTYYSPATSLVKVQPTQSGRQLLVGDAITQTLYQINPQLQPFDSLNRIGAIVDATWLDTALLVCNIGILNPNNGTSGQAQSIAIGQDGKLQKDTATLFKNLRRPVQLTAADLNNDGKEDYLVCEFGYMTGALTWMENKGANQYERHVLRPLPGALKAYIHDYNKDGLPDIWVLMAQGEEGVFLYTNKGNGQFAEKQVLRFPPVYGSSYFELADFNKDGYPDIVYTCGDNADYSPILKPYHGVYIFLNDGHNRFTQRYFYPIHGCYKAIARDFDGDGDLDIATIAFFPDFKNRPEEGFVYLENKGNFQFQPYSLPQTQMGRWLTMDAGDLDGDGRLDLVLGNFTIGPAQLHSKYDWKKGPPYMVLKNRGKAVVEKSPKPIF